MEWVKRMGLIDLGYSGLNFTWGHDVDMAIRKAGWLDRILCDVRWRSLFQETSIRHLPHSDHCPLLLCLESQDGTRLGDRPFRFLASWMTHSSFFPWMEQQWHWEGDLMSTLKSFKEKLIAWNHDTFGSIFKRKKRALTRLEGIQKAMARSLSNELLIFEGAAKEGMG